MRALTIKYILLVAFAGLLIWTGKVLPLGLKITAYVMIGIVIATATYTYFANAISGTDAKTMPLIDS